jgi:D-alanine-D-alanine ligase
LPAAQEDDIRDLALKAFKILGAQNWGRVDVMLDETGKHYLLEVNTAPGMTSHSLVPKAAHAVGVEFDDLILRILDGAHVG